MVALALPLLAWSSRVHLAHWFLWAGGIPLALSVVAPSVLYLCSQRATYRDWALRALLLPALIAIGVGIAVNNTRAVLEALFGGRGDFVRTPKYGVTGKAPVLERRRRAYRVTPQASSWLEVVLGLYCLATTLAYAQAGRWLAVPLLALYAIGFTAVGILSVAHAMRSRPV